MEQLFEFIGNHLILFSLLIAITVMLIWNLYGGAISGVKQLSPAAVTQLINHDHAVVLDVRSAGDYEKGHILGSVSYPEREIPERREALEKYKKRPVVVCCELGNTADRVVRSLKASGFERAYSLKGGILSWRNANLPLTKD
jgi:rhodanese-related sulfurtransferase